MRPYGVTLLGFLLATPASARFNQDAGPSLGQTRPYRVALVTGSGHAVELWRDFHNDSFTTKPGTNRNLAFIGSITHHKFFHMCQGSATMPMPTVTSISACMSDKVCCRS